MNTIMSFMTQGIVKYSFQIIGALIILVVGWVSSSLVAKGVGRGLQKKRLDVTVEKFLIQSARLVMLAFVVMLALSALGVQIAPLIAGFSVAGVGLGLALQGPLSNYASGATLIFTKPFKVGDNIEIKGFQGQVKDITLPRTELLAGDGSTVVIPNKHIIGEVIKNYSIFRQLEINVCIAYHSDVQVALSTIQKIITSDLRIPSSEPYQVGINAFTDLGIKLQAFVWVPQDKLLDIKFDINRAIYDQFNQQGIVMAYPRRDVYIYQK